MYIQSKNTKLKQIFIYFFRTKMASRLPEVSVGQIFDLELEVKLIKDSLDTNNLYLASIMNKPMGDNQKSTTLTPPASFDHQAE